MPTYQYRCADCGNDLEAVQKFTDDPLTECPTCGGGLRKRFGAVGIVFKGSGFYATDNRTKGARNAAGGKSDTKASSASSSGSGASSSAESSGSSSPASSGSSSSTGSSAKKDVSAA
ncbi:FmdB family zinc ribbon protein [Propionicicella superfundia]|uniref:FmdB family zinc ribbon protein n=1 Tax=Propionicicella superfundia TaxID=348582 RepID=UPI000406536D|nr:FmdB family zinc ribbon protein [Propionicicella superfundia]